MTNAARPYPSRILVVDDIEDNHVLMSRALRRAGFETEALDNGVDTIARVSTNPPDLILLDWMMPGLSGMEVLLAIRERYSADELPIIMCTAREESSCISEAIDCGANDYVQKPVDMQAAVARIRAQLERRDTLKSLSSINRDLEQTLAQRTRALMDTREQEADLVETPTTTSVPMEDVQELMRLANWLRESEDTSDPTLLAACADSLTTIARRLAAA